MSKVILYGDSKTTKFARKNLRALNKEIKKKVLDNLSDKLFTLSEQEVSQALLELINRIDFSFYKENIEREIYKNFKDFRNAIKFYIRKYKKTKKFFITKARKKTPAKYSFLKLSKDSAKRIAKDDFYLRDEFLDFDFDSFLVSEVGTQISGTVSQSLPSALSVSATEAVQRIFYDEVINQTLVSPSAVVNQIQKALNTSTRYQAERIFRTEYGKMMSEATYSQAEKLQTKKYIKKKMWLSKRDTRTRGQDSQDYANHFTMNRKKINMSDRFEIPDKKLGTVYAKKPKESGMPAHQVINCRCQLVFE